MAIKKVILFGVIASFAVLSLYCSQDNQPTSSAIVKDRTLSLSIALPPDSAGSIVQAIAVISAFDMDSITQSLQVQKTRVTGTVKGIPLGYGRHIELELFNSRGTLVYYGDAYVDILSDNPIDVTIKLRRMGGTVNIIGTITDSSADDAAFALDSGTVFLARFNGSLTDIAYGDSGMVTNGWFVKSLFGEGVTLDTFGGQKAICRFPNAPQLSLSSGTMEALVFADTVTSDYTHIIDKSWQYGLTAYNGKLAVHFGSGWWYSNIPLPLKQWAYVCGSFDGTTIKLYLDGELVASANYSGGYGSPTYDLGIGNAAADSHNVPFHGIIDEVRISRIVRSDAEIANNWMRIEETMTR
jgi:hypothetical protein